MNSMDASAPAATWRNPRYAILILLSFALLALAPPAWSQTVTLDEDGRVPGALDSQGPRSVILTWTTGVYTSGDFSPALTRDDLGVADPADAENPIRGLEIVGESLVTISGQGPFATSLDVEDFFVPGSAPTDGFDANAAPAGLQSEIRVRALVAPNVFGYEYFGTIAVVRYDDMDGDGTIDLDADSDGALDINGPERFVDTSNQQIIKIAVNAVNDAPVVVGARSTPLSIAEGSLITGDNDDPTVSMVVTVAAHGSDGNLRDGSPSERQDLTLTVAGMVTQGAADYTVRIEGADITNRVLLTLGTSAESRAVALDAGGVIPSGEVFLTYWTDAPDARAAITLTPNDGTVAGAPFSFDVAPRPYLDVSTEDATITREHTVPSDTLARDLTVATGLRLPVSVNDRAVTARFTEDTTSRFLIFGEQVRYNNGSIVLMNVYRDPDTFGELTMMGITLTATIELDTGTGNDAAFYRFGEVTITLEPDVERITPTVVQLFISVPDGASAAQSVTIATVSLESDQMADDQALLNASLVAPPEASTSPFTAGPSIVGGEIATNEQFIRVEFTPNAASTEGGLWTATVVQSFVTAGLTTTATVGVLSIAFEREGYALPSLDLRAPRAMIAADLNSATITLEQVRPLRSGVEYSAYILRDDGADGVDERPSTMSITRVEGSRADIEFTFGRASHIPFFTPRSPYRFVAIAKHGEQASTQSIVVTAPAGRSTDGVYYDTALCMGTGPDHDSDGVPSSVEATLGTDCNNDNSYFVGPRPINLANVLTAAVEYRAGVSRSLPLTDLCNDAACGNLILTVWANCPATPDVFDPVLDIGSGNVRDCRLATGGGYVYLDTNIDFYIVGRDRLGNWSRMRESYAATEGETRFNTTVMSFLPGATNAAGSRAEVTMTYLSGVDEQVSVSLRVPSDGDELNPAPRDYSISFGGDSSPDCEGAWCIYEAVIMATADTLEAVTILAWDAAPNEIGGTITANILSDDMATTPTQIAVANLTISEFAAGALLSGVPLGLTDVETEADTTYTITVINPAAMSTNSVVISGEYSYTSVRLTETETETEVTITTGTSTVIITEADGSTRQVLTELTEVMTTTMTMTATVLTTITTDAEETIEFLPNVATIIRELDIEVPRLDTGTRPVTLSIGVRAGSRLIQEWRNTAVLDQDSASQIGTTVSALRGSVIPGTWARDDWTGGSVRYHVPIATLIEQGNAPPGSSPTYLPEIFDYRVYLPLGETQAHVVIELPTSTGAYRYSAVKYREGLGWMNFITRGGDNVFWARRSPETNNCPPASLDAGTAGSSWYVNSRGNEGCVMVRLTDGGPNDDDGVSGANRIIVDPVAFTQVGRALGPGEFPSAAATSGGGGGGGSVSALWLMLLGLFLAFSVAFRAGRHARVR